MAGVSSATMTVALPAGPADVSVDVHAPDAPWAVAALAHGAGAGLRHPFLVGLASALADAGITVLRFAFPYSEAGRRMPGPASHATTTWQAVEAAARDRHPGLPFAALGKSYGGRMASMAAAEGLIHPQSLVYLGYPLHPPGRPESPRIAHLPLIEPPQLFLEGTADPFVDPHDQLEAAVRDCRDARIVWVEGGGHSFEVKGRRRPAEDVGAGLAPIVLDELRRVLR